MVAGTAFLCLAAAGCKRGVAESAKDVKVGETTQYIEQMAPGDVIVELNGVSLTRERYDDELAVKEALYTFARPQAKAIELKRYRKQCSRMVVNEFVARQAILQAAEAKRHQPSAAAVQASRAELCKVLKVEDGALEEKCKALGRVGRSLTKLREENAMIRSFREAEHQERLRVSDEEVEAQFKKIKDYHARAEATNQLVMAKGKALCAQLRSGADFMELAGRYSEADDETLGEWGTFLKSEIENDQIREAAFSLPIGQVSEPFDTDEGLVIIKVLERTKAVYGPTTVPGSPETVRLGRLVLRMAEGGAHVPLPSREAVRQSVAKQKIKTLQEEWIPALVAEARIVYPNGTNLWRVAEQKSSDTRRKSMTLPNKEKKP